LKPEEDPGSGKGKLKGVKIIRARDLGGVTKRNPGFARFVGKKKLRDFLPAASGERIIKGKRRQSLITCGLEKRKGVFRNLSYPISRGRISVGQRNVLP